MANLDTYLISAKNEFKEDFPSKTIERIKAILSDYGISTVEKWKDSGVPYCYSVRVNVLGTVFGSNGKGVTKELALASGYGELMERLQLGWIFTEDLQKMSIPMDMLQSERVSIKEILHKHPKWYSMYADELKKYTGEELSAEQLMSQYTDDSGTLEVVPYYCVSSDTVEYLPNSIRNLIYSSNGCAAGNTAEEAIVQALSEIVERHYMLKILQEGISVPEIPEEVLKEYNVSYETISFLRNNGFFVSIKDCSLGGKFPVVCVCMVDKSTGRYYTHFGAFPKLGIAIQRTLTESFQGISLDEIGKFEDFCLLKEDMYDPRYLTHQLVKGTTLKTPQFFVNISNQPYNYGVGFKGESNKELLAECLDFFAEQGYDVLIRDSSSLGFPTFQVIIPGYSEVFPQRLSVNYNGGEFSESAYKVMRNPAEASIADIMGFMKFVNQAKQRNIGIRFLKVANLAVDISKTEEKFYLHGVMAYVYYVLNKRVLVIDQINKMILYANREDTEYLICVKRYLALAEAGYDAEKIRKVLEYFHKDISIDMLFQSVTKDENPLKRLVVQCDGQNCSKCRLSAMCKKKETDDLAILINKERMKLDQSSLCNLFNDRRTK